GKGKKVLAGAGEPGGEQELFRSTASITGPEGDEFTFEPLDPDGSQDKKGGDAYDLSLEEGEGGKLCLEISAGEEADWKCVLGYVTYNPDKYNPVDLTKGSMFPEDDSELMVAPIYKEKGKFAFWVGMLNFPEKEPKDGGSICTITFNYEPWEPPKDPSDAPDEANDAVLEIVGGEDVYDNFPRYIHWGEMNRGDGDLSSEVAVGDLTPLAAYNTWTIAEHPLLDPVDYDDDGTIESGLGAGDYAYVNNNYLETVDGYIVNIREEEDGDIIESFEVEGPIMYDTDPYTKDRFHYFHYYDGVTDAEDPLSALPEGWFWNDNGAVGYGYTVPTFEDGTGYFWVSVTPYDGEDEGYESDQFQIYLGDDNNADAVRVFVNASEQVIDPEDDINVYFEILENEVPLWNLNSIAVQVIQDSDIVDWDNCSYNYFNSAASFWYHHITESYTFLPGFVLPTPTSGNSRRIDLNYSWIGVDEGVPVGTAAPLGLLQIPTKANSEGYVTVQLVEYADGSYRTWYSENATPEYFDYVNPTIYTFQIGDPE
ncbi:MAG: hypothetical protein HRF49_11260, partial [bacterium]